MPLHHDSGVAILSSAPHSAWREVETLLRQWMTLFPPDRSPAIRTNGPATPETVFERLTAREFCYLGKSRVEPYRRPILAHLESAIRNEEPIDFSYDLGAGYHASLEPGRREPSFDVGLGELCVLGQIARFARSVASVHAPGVRFHIVIDNLCAWLVNDIPLERTASYCAQFRNLIQATGMAELVTLIVESEHFGVADFRGSSGLAAPDEEDALDAHTLENVARFLGRPCAPREAMARIRRYRDVIPESERLLETVIRGVHMTQRASPETLCFRPFPGADSRIQCGEVALRRNVKGRLVPFLLTSQNLASHRCERAGFPSILPAPIGAITWAEMLAPAGWDGG
jgi:hypothetical protein